MKLQKLKEFVEGKITQTISNWVLVPFLFIHFSYEFWGVPNALNKCLFNFTLYGFLAYVFFRLYRLEKNYLLLVASIFWGYFAITELWFGLRF